MACITKHLENGMSICPSRAGEPKHQRLRRTGSTKGRRFAITLNMETQSCFQVIPVVDTRPPEGNVNAGHDGGSWDKEMDGFRCLAYKYTWLHGRVGQRWWRRCPPESAGRKQMSVRIS